MRNKLKQAEHLSWIIMNMVHQETVPQNQTYVYSYYHTLRGQQVSFEFVKGIEPDHHEIFERMQSDICNLCEELYREGYKAALIDLITIIYVQFNKKEKVDFSWLVEQNTHFRELMQQEGITI